MEDPLDRRRRAFQDSAYRGSVAQVDDLGADRHAGDMHFDRATRQQKQMPRTLLDHPGLELAADRAGTARDHVGRVAAKARAVEGELTDVARTLQDAQRTG